MILANYFSLFLSLDLGGNEKKKFFGCVGEREVRFSLKSEIVCRKKL